MNYVCDTCRAGRPWLLSCACTLTRATETEADRKLARASGPVGAPPFPPLPHDVGRVVDIPSPMPVTTRRWWNDFTNERSAVIDRIEYAAEDIAWLSNVGMRWDNTDKVGRGKARPSDEHSDGMFAVEALELEDIARQSSVRTSADDPVDDLAIRAYRRRLREAARVRVPELPRVRKLPAYRFSPTDLSTEALGRKYLGEHLSPRARRHVDLALDVMEERHLSVQPMRKAGLKGNDHGWALPGGVHRGHRLLARRRALDRVEYNVMAYVEQGVDAVEIHQRDQQLLVDTINDAAQKLLPQGFALLQWLVSQADPVEAALSKMAEAAGLVTAKVRGLVATELVKFRRPLARWGTGREGGWMPDTTVYDGQAAKDVIALGRDAERLEPPKGRPPGHDVGVAFWAVHLADRIAQRLHSDAVLALAAINGTLRNGVPVQPLGIAAELYLAAGREVSLVLAWAAEERPGGVPLPGVPDLADVIEVVASSRLGRQTSLESVTRAVAGLAYGIPKRALDALVKKAAKSARVDLFQSRGAAPRAYQ